jgi:hypothetical protein
MPSAPTADIGELLRHLTKARVEFIIVGGAAAVLHGAPITTEDLDIVHRRTGDNVARLKAALDELGAYVRELADRKLPPSASALKGEGTSPSRPPSARSSGALDSKSSFPTANRSRTRASSSESSTYPR